MSNKLRTSILVISFFLVGNSFSQVIFSESFDDGEDAVTGIGDVSGVPWTAICPESIDDGDYFKIQGGKLVGQDTNGPAVWQTEAIDISSCDFIDIAVELSEEGTMEACGTGCNSVDYVQLEFNIDGTGWMSPPDAFFCDGECADVLVIHADDIEAALLAYSTGCIAAGTELELRITVQAWAASERWLIDNVSVSCADGPSIDAGDDITICEGSEVTLTAENPDGASITWDGGVTDGDSFTPPLGENDYTVTGTLGECTATDEVTITVTEGVVVTIEAAGPFTIGSGVQTLEATPDGGVWSSDCGACLNALTGEFDPAIAGPGSWEVCYAAGVAPCDDIACTTIIVTDGDCALTGTLSFNNPTCFGFTDGSVTINMLGETGDLTYTITDSEGTVLNIDNSNTANTLGEGWYYFNVADEFPCVFIDSIFLDDPDQMEANLIANNPLCYDDNSGFAFIDTVFNPTGDYSLLSYFWAPNPTGVNGIGEDSLQNIGAGDYSIIINDENGCSITLDFELTNPDSLYLNEFEYDPAYCRLYGYQSGNGVVFASATGGTPDYDYSWLNISTGETTDNTTWGGLNPGNYQISVTDDNGCVFIETITVDSLNPIADFDLTSPEFTSDYQGTATVNATFVNTSLNFSNLNDPGADTTFFWNFGLGATVLSTDYEEVFNIAYSDAGTYDVCLYAYNKNGCVDSNCVVIEVFDPFGFQTINVFTPNNDDNNDLFSFDNKAQSVATFNCVIVNRWGKVVFEFTDISQSWNGLMPNGNVAPEGVYFYVYTGQAFNGINFEGQGNVHLVR